jgi:hypothetical protein
VFNARREEVFEVYANVDNSLGRHPFLQSITHHQDTCLKINGAASVQTYNQP